MEINIQSTTKQVASCGELDRLAHDYLGVPTTLDDEASAGCRQGDTFNLPTPITATDGVYSDTKAAFATKDITINGTEYQRILDPAVLSVLLSNFTHAAEGKFTPSEMAAITDIGTLFQSNEDIVAFDELSKTGVTALSGGMFYNCTNLRSLGLDKITSMASGTNMFANSGLQLLYAPKATQITTAYNYQKGFAKGCSNLKAAFFPACVSFGTSSFYNYEFYNCPKLRVVDFGENLASCAVDWFNQTGKIVIFRSSNVTRKVNVGTKPSYLFVPQEAKEAILANFSDMSSICYEIGGEDWQTAMSGLSKEEGWNEEGVPEEYQEDIYSYPYVDYLIYGLNPPEGN